MATQQFVKRWSQSFSEVVVYTLHEGERFQQDNIKVKTFSQMPFLIAALGKLKRARRIPFTIRMTISVSYWAY